MAQRDALRRDLAEDEQTDRHRGDRDESAPRREEVREEPVPERRDREVDEGVADEQGREQRGRILDAPADPLVGLGTARLDPRALYPGQGKQQGLGPREEGREAEQQHECRDFQRMRRHLDTILPFWTDSVTGGRADSADSGKC